MKAYLFFTFGLCVLVACGTLPERSEEQEFEELRARVQEEPQKAELKLQLGESLAKRGYSGGAFKVWEEGAAEHPGDLRFLRNIADHQYAIGEEAAAVQSYEKYLAQLNTPDPLVIYKIGWASLHLRDYKKALSSFDAYTQKVPDDASGFVGLGQAQDGISSQAGQEGEADRAISSFQRAIALSPGQPELRHNLAVLLEKRGNLDGAKAEYSRVIETAPNFLPSLENLALILIQRGETSAAKPLLERALLLETQADRKRGIQSKLRALEGESSPTNK